MLHPAVTEAEAFIALQAGGERGLDCFFHRYYAPLTYYCQSIVHTQAAAEEIASECFVKLWHYRATLTHCGAVKPLLFRMAYNASVDYLREQQTRTKHTKRFAQQPVLPTENEALQKLTESQTFHHVYRFLHVLPPRTRQIFVLFYFRHKTNAEISEELGLTVGTVRGLKFRAVQLLKKHLYAPILFFFICYTAFLV